MSAYTTIYRALTDGRPLPPDEVAGLLAAYRCELGDELANALVQHAREQFPADFQGTQTGQRKAKRSYTAMCRAAEWIRRATATGRLTTTPTQRRAS